MINFIQLNQNIVVKQNNILNEEVWKQLAHKFRYEFNHNSLKLFIHQISIHYNVDKKQIIKDYFSFKIKTDATLSSHMLNIMEGVIHNYDCNIDVLCEYISKLKIPKKNLTNDFKMQMMFAGAKIALGPRIVGSHQDSWDGISIQCKGVATWTIRHNETAYEEIFEMHPGDLIYFPQECTHEITSNTARANLIFNMPTEHLLS